MAEELRILYEDPYLVVCVKPVGVLSEDSESGRSLPRMLAEHYRQAGKPDYIATAGQDRGRGDGIVPATGGHGQADGGHSRS